MKRQEEIVIKQEENVKRQELMIKALFEKVSPSDHTLPPIIMNRQVTKLED